MYMMDDEGECGKQMDLDRNDRACTGWKEAEKENICATPALSQKGWHQQFMTCCGSELSSCRKSDWGREEKYSGE